MTKQELIVGHLLILWLTLAALGIVLALQHRRFLWSHVALIGILTLVTKAIVHFTLYP